MKFTKRLAIGFVVLALALTGCSSSSEEAVDCTEPILIGAAMAQTGFMSPFDGPALTTAQIAVDKINAAGGVNGCQLVLEAVDTETNPDKGQQIATDLIAKGAKLLLVTCDADINLKSSQVANDAGVLVIAPCVGSTAMGPDNGLDLGYSLGSAVPGEAAIMAEYAYEKLGQTATLFKDMSIAYTTSQCDAFETRFKELGGTVKSVQQFSQTQAGALDKPVKAQVANAKKDAAGVIALCSYPGGGAEALAAIRAGGLNTPVISGFGLDGAFWLGAVPNLSNFTTVTYASVFGDDSNPKVVELLAAFKEKTGQDAATGGLITGASAIEAFALAATRAGSFDGAAMAAEMNKFANEDLTAGPTSFTDTLHVNVSRPMAVITVTDGKHAFVEYRAAVKPTFPTK
ncbi:MAG: ABC transporter substrate-binding protein [Actinobacteria bacterium]|jgi:branched-chain amino acid transport system substrate-binding protein|nr:ABC transporter substrate-binding protein [Actinomycetota bacterium]